jgi:hypothetical protein
MKIRRVIEVIMERRRYIAGGVDAAPATNG